jgi:DNA-binding Xre family transcriptional regulator
MINVDSWLKKKNIPKKALADYLGIAPQNLNRVIRNPRIPIPLLERIAGFLGISLKELILFPKDIRLMQVDSDLRQVPLILQFQYSNYLNIVANRVKMEEFHFASPKVPFLVDRQFKGNYLAFEMSGDAMDDGSRDSYVAGDILLVREIDRKHWNTPLPIRRWKDYVLLHRVEGVLVRQITQHLRADQRVVTHPLNPLYEDRTYSLEELHKLFHIVKTIRHL